MQPITKLVYHPIAMFGLVAILLIGGCGRQLVGERSIPANINIEVKDPLCRRLTNATEKFEVLASGQFKAGSFVIQGIPVRVSKGTLFKLDLVLPINDPAHINAALATGHLWTSSPLLVGGVPVAQEVSLSNGKATAEVDLVRMLGIFLFNVLQNQVVDDSGGNGVKTIVESIRVKHSVLSLRPGASFDIGKIHLIAAPHSKIELKDVLLDRAWNYDGELLFDMRLAEGCNYIGDKFDIYFNGGSALLALHARRIQRLLTFSSAHQQRMLVMEDCTYRFGKEKQSSVKAEVASLSFSQFSWQKREEDDKAQIHAVAGMLLERTHLTLKNPRTTLTATLAQPIPATLQIDRDLNDHQILFSTNKSATAGNLDIDLTRKSTNTSIALTNAKVGPISLTKSGDLQFSLDDGKAALRSINWQRGKKQFKLVTSAGSTVSITEGLSMALTRDENGTHCSLPLSINLGTATLSGSFGTLKLAAFTGDLLVNADNEVSIEGNVDFSIVQSDLLGNQVVNVKVHGIDVASKEGQAVIHFNECSITVPNKAVHAEIVKGLPKEKIYSMTRTVFGPQKWRYRNAVVKSIILRNPTIEKLWSVKNNSERFTGHGDIEVRGTVEKSGILSMWKQTNDWEERPWRATAHVSGSGTLDYDFIPNGALADSQFKYALCMNLPLPDDLDLDWSKVSTGLMQKAEKSIIIGVVKKRPPITLNYQGKFRLFADRNSQLKSLKIQRFKTEPSSAGIEMKFVADAAF